MRSDESWLSVDRDEFEESRPWDAQVPWWAADMINFPAPIESWWPLLKEECRSVLVNGLWQPVSDYVLTDIAANGGPVRESGYFDVRDDEYYLPQHAALWIVRSPSSSDLKARVQPDPRAAYFRRGWPQRGA